MGRVLALLYIFIFKLLEEQEFMQSFCNEKAKEQENNIGFHIQIPNDSFLHVKPILLYSELSALENTWRNSDMVPTLKRTI